MKKTKNTNQTSRCSKIVGKDLEISKIFENSDVFFLNCKNKPKIFQKSEIRRKTPQKLDKSPDSVQINPKADITTEIAGSKNKCKALNDSPDNIDDDSNDVANPGTDVMLRVMLMAVVAVMVTVVMMTVHYSSGLKTIYFTM